MSEPDLRGVADVRDPAGDGGPAVTVTLGDLEVALLGLLSVRPMTGYDIGLHFDRALAPWWDTPRTQIYPKLRDLAGRGLVRESYVVQRSKPNKRVYSLTESGHAALRRWLALPIERSRTRQHMMMHMFLGNLVDAGELQERLRSYRQELMGEARRWRGIRERFTRSLSGPYRQAVYFELLALEYLIEATEFEASWIDRVVPLADDATGVGQEHTDRLLDMMREALR